MSPSLYLPSSCEGSLNWGGGGGGGGRCLESQGEEVVGPLGHLGPLIANNWKVVSIFCRSFRQHMKVDDKVT